MGSASGDVLAQLSAAGVAVWLDDISRERLQAGELTRLVQHDHVVGVTSNPTIFAAALSKGSAYDDQLRDLAARRVEVDEAVRDITTYDIRWACDLLREVYEQTGHRDGKVSLEVDPRLADDALATVAEARALWWKVDRPNLYIKIPATVAGLTAIEQAIAEGISVNVTLIFSLERYEAVIEAYLRGLGKAAEAGHDLSRISSVASFFVSRVDTEVSKRLDAVGTHEAAAMRGKAAIANARLAYDLYQQKFRSPEWDELSDRGAQPQRPLWASTSVKDPSFRDTMYVEELVAPDTVNTMPESTIEAVAKHGELRGDTVRGTWDASRQVFSDLERLGISYDDVVAVLERQGVEAFAASWSELADTVRGQLDRAIAS